MTTAQALFDFTIQTQDSIEQALYFRARLGHRGFLEVPAPVVSTNDYGGTMISQPDFIWHPVGAPILPAKSTQGGRSTFFDLTNEATIAAALKAKEGR